MRIAVMGTGGVGGYYGGLMARAGEEVVFIARGAHLAAIQRNGLRVVSDLSGEFTVHSEATDDPAAVAPVDLVLYTVKMYHNEQAIPAIRPMVGPDTVVLTLQNGIDNGDKLAATLGERHVMIGVAYVVARIEEPGVVAQLGTVGRVVFGEMGVGISSRAKGLQQAFQRAGWNPELTADAQGGVWQKYIYLVGVAGVSAASRTTYGEMRTTPATRELVHGAWSEAMALARAKEVAVAEDTLEWAKGVLDSVSPDALTSMAKDVIEGNRIELEGLTGTVVRLGRELSVPTPINSTIYALLQPSAMRTAKSAT